MTKTEAEKLKEEAERLFKETKEINVKIADLDKTRKEAMKTLKEFEKKKKEFLSRLRRIRMQRDDEECDIVNGDWKVRLYEVICYKDVEDWEQPRKYYEIDLYGDPSFNCQHCETEHNHTEVFNKVGEKKFQDDSHTVRLLAELTITELLKLVLGEP